MHLKANLRLAMKAYVTHGAVVSYPDVQKYQFVGTFLSKLSTPTYTYIKLCQPNHNLILFRNWFN